MVGSTSDPKFEQDRRRFLHTGSAFALVGALEIPFGLLARAAGYAESIAALKKGVSTETNAHRRYVAFGRHSKNEGYKGLAYLYTALATSELIHAQNYIRVLATLGELVSEQEAGKIPVRTAKENLIYAAERELISIEKTYPELLQAVDGEGHSDTITVIQYSWTSHKQHLEIIEKIQRWSPSFFESVARKIDEKTDRYFVCQVCGSTVTKMPDDACPVCKESSSKYRLIPHDSFF